MLGRLPPARHIGRAGLAAAHWQTAAHWPDGLEIAHAENAQNASSVMRPACDMVSGGAKQFSLKQPSSYGAANGRRSG